MNKLIKLTRPLLLPAAFLFLWGCSVDTSYERDISACGSNSFSCEVNGSVFTALTVSCSKNAKRDSLYLSFSALFGKDKASELSKKLSTIQIRLAKSEIVEDERIPREGDGEIRVENRILQDSEWKTIRATGVSGYVRFWKRSPTFLAGQLELQADMPDVHLSITKGIFDVTTPEAK